MGVPKFREGRTPASPVRPQRPISRSDGGVHEYSLVSRTARPYAASVSIDRADAVVPTRADPGVDLEQLGADRPSASRPGQRLTAEGTHSGSFHPQDWLFLILPGLIWGASFLLIAEGLNAFAPGAVTFMRIAFGCITLGLIPAARSKVAREDWPRIIVLGVTWMAFPMTLFPLAQQHISSSLAGMLNGAIPIFVTIVAATSLRRLPGRWQLAGIVVGAAGIAMMGLRSLGEGGSTALGVVMILVAVSSYGVAVNISVPLTQKYGAIPVFWRAQIVSVVLTAPYGIYGLGHSHWSAKPFLAVLVLGIFGTALTFVMMTTLAARVGATRASILTYLEAVVALILGVLVRHDTVRLIEVLGCFVVLAGAWCTSHAETPAADASAAIEAIRAVEASPR